jgi:hypothetical protein
MGAKCCYNNAENSSKWTVKFDPSGVNRDKDAKPSPYHPTSNSLKDYSAWADTTSNSRVSYSDVTERFTLGSNIEWILYTYPPSKVTGEEVMSRYPNSAMREKETPLKRYFGQLDDLDRPHGWGHFFDSVDKVLWIGEFDKGVLNGPAQVYYDNGDYFEGEVLQGKLVHGRLYIPGGDMYEGPFQKDLPFSHTEGKILFRDGNKYLGGVRNGKMDGQGTITFPNGHWKRCLFSDGEAIEILMEGNNKNFR